MIIAFLRMIARDGLKYCCDRGESCGTWDAHDVAGSARNGDVLGSGERVVLSIFWRAGHLPKDHFPRWDTTLVKTTVSVPFGTQWFSCRRKKKLTSTLCPHHF